MNPQRTNQGITSEDLRQQLEHLRDFTAAEFAAQRSHYLNLWSMPLEARVAEGLCIPELRFERRTAEGQYRFRYKENETDFREGDFLRLSEGGPPETRPGPEASTSMAATGTLTGFITDLVGALRKRLPEALHGGSRFGQSTGRSDSGLRTSPR